MNPELEKLMWSAGKKPISDSTWRSIISSLLDAFEEFIGEKIERDVEVSVDSQHSDFAVWIWSRPGSESLLSTVWSGVVAGCVMKDEMGNEAFGVTADVFMFHGPDGKRLVTHDGKHYLQFAFTRDAGREGKWAFLGWVRDEFGEWEGLVTS